MMMSAMRSKAMKLIVYPMLGLIVVSFVFWGISDVFVNRQANKPLATVGDSPISVEDFRTVYEQTKAQFRGMMKGQKISDDTLVRTGVPKQVLEGLVTDRLLRLEAAASNLVVDDAAVAKATRENSSFHNMAGSFDRDAFNAALQQMGMSEKSYIKEMKASESSRILSHIALLPSVLHPALTQTVYYLNQETRDASVWIFSASLLKQKPEPTEADITAYYASHQSEFTMPELRTLGLVVFDPNELERQTTIPDAQIEKAYNDNIASFITPEKRDVAQIIFKDEASAKQAVAALERGDAMDAVAEKAGLKVVNLSAQTKGKLLPDVQNAVFALAPGKPSAPIKTPFGWHVFKVTTIIPSIQQTLEGARDTLRKQLTKEAVEDALYKQMDTVDEAISNGAALADAARSAGLTMQTLEPLDANGFNAAGAAVKALPKNADLLEKAFALPVGQTTSGITLADGRTVVAGVLAIEKSHAKPLAEVTAEIRQRWQKKAIADAVAQLAKKVASGKGDVGLDARAEGAFQARMTNLKRNNPATLRDLKKQTVTVPEAMLNAIFATPEGAATPVVTLESGDVAFAIVDAVTPAPKLELDSSNPSPLMERTIQSAQTDITADMYALYIEHLKTKYPVVIDQARFRELTQPAATAPTPTE